MVTAEGLYWFQRDAELTHSKPSRPRNEGVCFCILRFPLVPQLRTRMKRFFILDGMAIAYRAYFAFINRPLMNSKGMNTSAVYGFINTLEMILSKENPEKIAVAFDTKEPTFRHKEYPEYKATRDAMPDDMVDQLPYLKQVVEAYNIPLLELPGYEADDIIGTLAKRAQDEDVECYMVTPDKDYMQLVNHKVFLYKPARVGNNFDIINTDGVKEKFGVTPEQVIDVLGLMGDSSDNIPGVKGIGEKTAIPLVQEFGSIQGIYDNIESITKKGTKKKLEEGRDEAFLSRKLVTIDTNVPIDVDPLDLDRSEKNFEALQELFTEMEFTRFLEQLAEESGGSVVGGMDTIEDRSAEYLIVKSVKELDDLVQSLESEKELCFDTETSGINPHESSLVGLSFAVEPGKAWYVPCNGDLSTEDVLKTLKPLFDGKRTLIGQNVKFDLEVLHHHGLISNAKLYDTMIASYILKPDGEHNMDALARQYLQYEPVSIKELIGKGKDQKSMADLPIDQVGRYAAEDADITLQIAQKLKPEIAKTKQEALLDDIEFPLIHVLTDMECHGVKIDTEAMQEIADEMEGHIERAKTSIYDHADGEFNINSTKQLSDVLFEQLGLPPGKKTKTGYSTDASVLEGLQGQHPIIDDILLYRQYTKLKSTYVDALPKMINPRTGMVHTNFNQTVAATGRLSSTDPNLQNIPIRTDAGREIRKAFVPSQDGWFIFSADYSQIELRLAAELSGDEGLLEAFQSGEDIHTSTAMRLFGNDKDEVTSEERRQAKTVNFGILYGISAFGLAQRLGISNPDAKDLIDLYFEKYPKINSYISETLGFAKENGFVETLKGRRRYIPDINNKNRNVRMFAERTAINAPIQGSAADMIKIAMVRVHNALKKESLKAKMLLQVHDELVFEAPENEIDDLREVVVSNMKTAFDLKVPIEVDSGTGANWLEAH